MSDNPLSGKVGLDTTDFKTAISSMNRDLRVIESGFRANAASLGDWGKTVDGLNMRMETLSDKIEIQRKKVSVLTDEYKRVAKEKGENSRAAENLKIKLNRETEALNKSERELRDTEDALEEMGDESNKAGKQVKKLGDNVEKAGKKTLNFKSILKGLGNVAKTSIKVLAGVAAGALAVAGAAVSMLASTIEPASDLNETLAKTQVVFEDNSAAVIAFGENADTSLGMSQNAALGAAATYGNLFRSMGIGLDVSADMSMSLVQLAGDLASFNNMDPTAVLDKLRAGLSGETEPLKSLGVNINQALLQERALELGLWDGVGALDAAAKAQASYSLIMEQTTLAQGDFERTSDGLANQQRILAAQWENAKATVGTALLPILETATGVMSSFLKSAMFTEGLETLVGWLDRLGGILEPIFSGGEIDASALGEELSGLIGEIFGELSGLIPVLVEVISGALPLLIEAGISILQGLIEGIVQNVPILLPAVIGILQQLITFISQNIPMLISAAIEIIMTLVEGIISMLPMLISAAFDIILAVVFGLVEALPELIAMVPEIIMTIVTTLIENLPMLIEAALELILALVTGLVEALPVLIAMVPEIIVSIVGTLIDNLPMIIGAAIEIVAALILGILGAVPDLLLAVVDLIEQLIQKFKETDWKSIGDNILAGIKEGFLGKWEDFKTGITAKFSELLGGVKDLLGIESPSTVFAGIGGNMALGLGGGFTDKMDQIQRQIKSAVGGIEANIGVGGLAFTGQGGGGTTYNSTANVYPGPVNNDIDIYRLSRQVAEAIRRNK